LLTSFASAIFEFLVVDCALRAFGWIESAKQKTPGAVDIDCAPIETPKKSPNRAENQKRKHYTY